MLFALIELRGVAPGAPGLGTLFDFVGFFWAELIIALSLCAIVAVPLGKVTRGNELRAEMVRHPDRRWREQRLGTPWLRSLTVGAHLGPR